MRRIAGLRGLEETVEEEIRKMPILNDIMDHNVLGREYKRGWAEGSKEGLREGIQDGIQRGIHQGELTVLRRLVAKRFGAIPAWADELLGVRSVEDLEALSIRLLEARSVEDLLH